ncbi:MAG: alkaline phosphatase family protein [Candidatus Odinarchaeia archaeon]
MIEAEKLIHQAESLIKPVKQYEGLYLPNYKRNITQVLPTIMKALGRDLREDTLYNDGYLKPYLKEVFSEDTMNVVFLVIDSLGFNDFLENSKLLKEKMLFFPISSVFPSITSSAITSIHTGSYPEEHGILGYKILIDELGVLVNTLNFATEGKGVKGSLIKAGIDFKKFIWKKSLHLAEHDQEDFLDVSLYNTSIAKSGLSTIINSEENIIPFENMVDGFSLIAKALNRKHSHKLIHMYLDIIDIIYHKYGPRSYQSKFSFELIEGFLQFLIKLLNNEDIKNTVLVIVSDHGQHHTTPEKVIKFDKGEVEKFSRVLRIKPGKSGRTLHFYSLADKVEEAYEMITEKIGGRGYTFTFNEISKIIEFKTKDLNKVKMRLGDIITILKNDYTASYKIEEKQIHKTDTALLGQHGGLSFEELNSFCGIIRLADIK